MVFCFSFRFSLWSDNCADDMCGPDRGHMVPAADAKQSQQAMSETFILSNIAPQVGEGFNRHCECSGVWGCG